MPNGAVELYVVRHAHASSLWVRLKLEPAAFVLEIEDNGRGLAGMDEKAARSRNGLGNMRKRMEDIGGSFAMAAGSEGGTRVRLTATLGKAWELNLTAALGPELRGTPSGFSSNRNAHPTEHHGTSRDSSTASQKRYRWSLP